MVGRWSFPFGKGTNQWIFSGFWYPSWLAGNFRPFPRGNTYRDFFWVLVNLNGRESILKVCLYACIWLILPQSDMAMEISNLFPRNTNLQLVDFPASYVSLPERKWLEVAYRRVIWSLPPCSGTSKNTIEHLVSFHRNQFLGNKKKSPKKYLGAKFKLLQ